MSYVVTRREQLKLVVVGTEVIVLILKKSTGFQFNADPDIEASAPEPIAFRVQFGKTVVAETAERVFTNPPETVRGPTPVPPQFMSNPTRTPVLV